MLLIQLHKNVWHFSSKNLFWIQIKTEMYAFWSLRVKKRILGVGQCLIEANLWDFTTRRKVINIVSCSTCGNIKKCVKLNLRYLPVISSTSYSMKKVTERHFAFNLWDIFLIGYFIFVNLYTRTQCYQPTFNKCNVHFEDIYLFLSSRNGFDCWHIIPLSISNQLYTQGKWLARI